MSALAKIHIAKKELQLHDDDYRAILKRVTGQSSSKGLSYVQIDAVIDEFKRMGWKPQVIAGGKPKVVHGKDGWPVREPGKSLYPKAVAAFESAKKARALWISLWQLGAIDDSSEAALEAFARRQLKCERMVWADQQQMYKLIEALKAMAERNGWSQDLSGYPPRAHLMILKRRLVHAIHQKWRGTNGPSYVNRANLAELSTAAAEYGQLLRAKLDGTGQ